MVNLNKNLVKIKPWTLQGWQVSAKSGLNRGLNRFKPVWQKQVSASFCQYIFNINIHKKLVWSMQQISSFAMVCCVETLLLMIINSYTLKH